MGTAIKKEEIMIRRAELKRYRRLSNDKEPRGVGERCVATRLRSWSYYSKVDGKLRRKITSATKAILKLGKLMWVYVAYSFAAVDIVVARLFQTHVIRTVVVGSSRTRPFCALGPP
jgi:hypothetical protein